MTTMWSFNIGRVRVVAAIEPDEDIDTSFDESGETAEKLDSGEWVAFGTVVRVYLNGAQIGEDSLWGSIYANPEEFFTAHRDPDPANRNCTVSGRPAGTVIGHYFPDMVKSAVGDARDWLRAAKIAA